MTSIYQKVLGSDFHKLHPKIQQRFGFSSQDQIASIGRGVMQKISRGEFYTLPFLYIGTWRNIMFPTQGKNIPFTIENYAYLDSFGRETVTWVRSFDFKKKQRRFDATMIYSESRKKIVDYLGDHQHLAVDIDLSVTPEGGLQLDSGEQRFYEGKLGFRFPMSFSGIAKVCESYDEDEEKFNISVEVRNPLWGFLFGYQGSFDVEYIKVKTEDIPTHVKPLREERRE